MKKKPGPPKLYPVRIQLQIDEKLRDRLCDWINKSWGDGINPKPIPVNAAIREAIRRMVD